MARCYRMRPPNGIKFLSNQFKVVFASLPHVSPPENETSKTTLNWFVKINWNRMILHQNINYKTQISQDQMCTDFFSGFWCSWSGIKKHVFATLFFRFQKKCRKMLLQRRLEWKRFFFSNVSSMFLKQRKTCYSKVVWH